jgi:hypothetical protein
MEDEAGGGVWMTYGELAKARAVKRAAAIRLARRHKWHRQPGNDGFARVLVPEDMTRPMERATRDIPDDDTEDDIADDTEDDREDVSRIVSVLEGAVTSLTGRAEAAEALVDRALAQLADVQTRADRADQALAAERTRADILRDRLDTAEVARRQAEETAETLRQAEARWQASGLWQRLRDAWRGDRGQG